MRISQKIAERNLIAARAKAAEAQKAAQAEYDAYMNSPEGQQAQRYQEYLAQLEKAKQAQANLKQELLAQGYTSTESGGIITLSAPSQTIRKRDESYSYVPNIYSFKDNVLVSQQSFQGRSYKGSLFSSLVYSKTLENPELFTYREKRYDVEGYSTDLRSESVVDIMGNVYSKEIWTPKDYENKYRPESPDYVGREVTKPENYDKFNAEQKKAWLKSQNAQGKYTQEQLALSKSLTNQEQVKRYGQVITPTKDEQPTTKRKKQIETNLALTSTTQKKEVERQGPGGPIVSFDMKPNPNSTVLPAGVFQPKLNIGVKQPGGTISAYEKPAAEQNLITDAKDYAREQRLNNNNFFQGNLDRAAFFIEDKAGSLNNGFVSDVAAPFVIGGVGIVTQTVAHPLQTGKETIKFITNPVKGVKDVQEQLTIMTQTKGESYAVSYLGGQLAGGYVVSEAALAAAKKSPVKLEYETYEINTKGGGTITVQDVGVKAGPYGYPIASRTVVKPAVENLGTGEFITDTTNLPFKAEPYTKSSLGTTKLNQPITPTDLGGPTFVPLTASGGQAFKGAIALTEAEQIRLQSKANTGYLLGSEKGLPVETYLTRVEGVKNRQATTKIVEELVGDKGIIYGSETTQQLPNDIVSIDYLGGQAKGQSLSSTQNKVTGDIDVMFKDLTVEEIKPLIADATKKLQAKGENVQVSERSGGTIIEFKGSGNKFLEAKSGINQESLGLGDTAPAGYLGVRFPDIKGGQAPESVPFGETNAITAGEQFQRKAAGATIISPGGEGTGATKAFSDPGVLGSNKPSNPRGLKDTAGQFQQGVGIIEIQSKSLNPVTRVKAAIAKRQLAKDFQSYTPEQQTDILNIMKEKTGTKIPLTTSQAPKVLSTSTSPSVSFVSVSPKTPTSPTTRIDMAQVSKMSSSSKSPTTESPSFVSSPTSMKSLSPTSPSPRTSPKTNSYSPSPPKTSNNGYSFKSPISPIPKSPTSPGPKSPSPSLSPSPRTSPGPKSPSPLAIPEKEKIPPPSTRPLFRPGQQTKQKENFEVFVRRNKQFKKIGESETIQGAINIGRTNVQNTAAASFKIKSLNNNANARGAIPINQYYESKKEPGTFIQRNKFRISTAGEKRDITFKGIMASRSSNRKSRRGFLW